MSLIPLPPADTPLAAEYDVRVQKLRERMAAAEADVVLLTGQNNIEYFSGHRSLSWTSNSRPLFFAVGRADAALVGSETEERNFSRAPHPYGACFYQGFLADAIPVLVDAVRRLASSPSPTVAIDYGADMFGRGSLALTQALDGMNGWLREAAALIWPIRMIKSRFEAEMKKTSFLIANAAFDAAIREARIGITELALYRSIQSRIVLNGAERPDPFPVVFSNGEFIYNRWPGERRLAAGDYVWTDFRSTFGGYPADRNRIARAGAPEPWEMRRYDTVRRLTLDLARSIRPGMTGGDAYGEFQRLWHAADLGEVYSRASRVGHGGGLDLTEPPSIMAGSREVIEEGMILHLEPKLETKGAVFQFEEVIYIGRDGNEFLTPLCPEELPVIA